MPSDAEQTSQPSGAMADRYYELAESMNQRGAMELAVPFYRQAVALLLAERESLQQQLQGGAVSPALKGSADQDALHGLLEAADVLTDKPVAAEPAVQPVEPSASPAPASPSVDQDQLEAQIAELSDELSAKTALQVMAGLKALADQTKGQLPASGLALLGKTQMVLGKPADSLKSFEAALVKDPQSLDLQINVGAAHLANQNVDAALEFLRGVWTAGLDQIDEKSRSALFRNLSSAEGKAGRPLVSLQLHRSWLAQLPDSVPIERALKCATQGLKLGENDGLIQKEALQLLRELRAVHPSESRIIQALADGLESVGDYKEAALLYRELLK